MLFQNLSRELVRSHGEQPPLREMVHLNDRVRRGEVKKLSLLQKKQLYVLQYSLVTVYFIAAPDVAMIKIGKTIDLKKRFATLKTMSPVPLQIACHIDYDESLEYRIHQHLKAHRSHGEWFHATKDVVDFMRGYCDGGVQWVVDRVGDCAGSWINHSGSMPEGMRGEKEFDWPWFDPDYHPNTQNESGIDFSRVSG